jgi:hypothetical protein
LKEPIFYEHVFDGSSGRNWVNQLCVTNGKVERTKVIDYGCKSHPPSAAVREGVRFSLAKNTPEISASDKDRFIKSGFSYCKGNARD